MHSTFQKSLLVSALTLFVFAGIGVSSQAFAVSSVPGQKFCKAFKGTHGFVRFGNKTKKNRMLSGARLCKASIPGGRAIPIANAARKAIKKVGIKKVCWRWSKDIVPGFIAPAINTVGAGISRCKGKVTW